MLLPGRLQSFVVAACAGTALLCLGCLVAELVSVSHELEALKAERAARAERSERRLANFVDIQTSSNMVASTGCLSITDAGGLSATLDAAAGCGASGTERCPPCVLFPAENAPASWSPADTGLTLTLSGCSTAKVSSSASLGQTTGSAGLQHALMGWTFINLRRRPVRVVAGGASVPDCAYAGREFSGAEGDYEELAGRCASLAAAGLTNGFTIAFTVRLDHADSTSRGILHLYEPASAVNEAPGTIHVDDVTFPSPNLQRNLRIRIRKDVGQANVAELMWTVSPNIGRRQRFMLVFDRAAGEGRLYREGELLSGQTSADLQGRDFSAAAIDVGRRNEQVLLNDLPADVKPLDGLLADLRIWNGALADWRDAVFEAAHDIPAMTTKRAFCASADTADGATNRLVWADDRTV